MYIRRLLLLILPIIFLVSACATEHSKIIVAEYDQSQINMGEFEKAYVENSGSAEMAKKDSIEALKSFLDLYVDYKMKLRDAFVRGYTTDPEMQKEITDYKANIGSTLFLNDSLYEPKLKNLYERRKWELRGAHIFLTPDSSMNEHQCMDLASRLIDSLNNGADFAELAKKYSKDTYTNKIGGDVYYVTAGQIPSPALEDALYSLEPGQVYQKPVRSAYGIHVLKLNQKIPRKSSIRVSHILVSIRDSIGKPMTDTTAAYQRILNIKKQLDEGGNFEELAKKYSDDKSTGEVGGDIGYLKRGQSVREFDQAAFLLDKDQISDIVKSPFGYHIIKVTDVKYDPSYEESKNDLKTMYDRYKYKPDLNLLIDHLKEEYHYKLNEGTIEKINANLDSLIIDSAFWTSPLHSELGNLPLFVLNNQTYAADSLFRYLEAKKYFLGRKMKPDEIKSGLQLYTNDLLPKIKGMDYDKDNKEFARLMDDYKNGVYLFKILDDEVWSKLSVDSTMIQNYYDQNKNNFMWKDRLEYKEIYVNSDSSAIKIYNMIQAGEDFDTLKAAYSQRRQNDPADNVAGLVAVDANELAVHANELKNIGDVSKPFQYKSGWSIVKLVNRDPARIKTFDEAKAEVASIVQDNESKRLEKEYLNKLKNIYQPKIYYDELSKAFKE